MTVFDLSAPANGGDHAMQQKFDDLLTDCQRREMARAWRDYGWMGGR